MPSSVRSPRYSEARTDTAAATCPLCSSVTVTVTVWLSSGFSGSQSQPDTAFPSTLSKCPFIFEVPARAMTQLTAVKSITSRRPATSLVFFMFTTSFLLSIRLIIAFPQLSLKHILSMNRVVITAI
mgnify:CR=1 FL=1